MGDALLSILMSVAIRWFVGLVGLLSLVALLMYFEILPS
jgi:hypothetical protein